MIKLQKSNVVKIVSSKEASEKLIAKGFAVVKETQGTVKSKPAKPPKPVKSFKTDGSENAAQKDGDGNGSDDSTNPPEASGGTQTEPQA